MSVKSGSYVIVNVKQKNSAHLVDDNDYETPICAFHSQDTLNAQWEVKQLANGKYFIQNSKHTGRYANAGHRAGKGETIKGWDEGQEWNIQETDDKRHYTIATTDSRLIWTLRDEEQKTPVTLSDLFTDARCWWMFKSLDVDRISSLEQPKHSGGPPVLAPALPHLTKTFVMRKVPWDFAEKALLEPKGPEENGSQRMLIVTGIGGCGKTQLMLNFLRVHSNKFISTHFVDGSSEARIRADIIRYVRSLGAMYSQTSFDDYLLILSQTSSERPRVIFYDNVDDPEIDIMPLLPRGDGCSIIITSRNHFIGDISPGTHLELDKMSMDEAVDLLLYSPNRFDFAADQTVVDARAVAEALDCLPIALQQARSYMREAGCSTKEYLERLHTNRHKLLTHKVKFHPEMRYLSTYAAFDASFGKLALRAQQLLRLFSFFHWIKFPLKLISLASEYNFSDYENTYIDHGGEHAVGVSLLKDILAPDGLWDITHLDELNISLQNYSLVTIIPGVDTILLEVHPLLHGWVQSCIPEHDRSSYQSAAITLLALGARSEYTPIGRYLPNHVMHLRSAWRQLHINDSAAFGVILCNGGHYQSACELLDKVVTVLRQQFSPLSKAASNSLWQLATIYQYLGRIQEAQGLREEVLVIQREAVQRYKEELGERHLNTIAESSRLASTYLSLGRLTEAKSLQQNVLKLRKELLGERHLETIKASTNLADIYTHLGQLQEAQVLYEGVLRLRRELLSDRHPDTITASSNLANIYSSLGRFDEAHVLHEAVLKLRRELFGDRHPDVITASSNLANSYADLGRFEESRVLQEEVLTMRKELLGDRHPDIILASSNLAITYSYLGRFDEALTLKEEVLKLRKEVLDERHPDTLMASTNLASTYSDLGRFDEALVLQEEVLRLYREVLGERHPDTITALNNLASTYSNLGRYSEALVLQDKALKLRGETLGERHPGTITTLNNLASTYSELGRFEEALVLQEEVLKLRRETLGKHHPDTITASNNLASTYSDVGRFEEALVLQEEVLKLRREIFGNRHPDTITASNNLASTYSDLGQFDEALVLQEEVLKLRRETLGEHHPDTITASNNIASTYSDLGRFDEALVLQEEVLRLRKEILGQQHPKTCETMLDLSETYGKLGKLSNTLDLLNVVDGIILEKLGNTHPLYKRCQDLRFNLQANQHSPTAPSSLPPPSPSSNTVSSAVENRSNTRGEIGRLVYKSKRPFS